MGQDQCLWSSEAEIPQKNNFFFPWKSKKWNSQLKKLRGISGYNFINARNR